MILRIFLTILSILCASKGFSQLNIGLRDTKFIYAGFKIHDWSLRLEHSVFSEPLKMQKIRCELGLWHDFSNFELGYKCYASTLWNCAYQDYGVSIGGSYYPIRILSLNATINPIYDSVLGYSTCFNVGGNVKITNVISVITRFTNIPEYRQPEKRARFGLSFNVDKLYVSTEISLPAATAITNARVLCNFQYTLW